MSTVTYRFTGPRVTTQRKGVCPDCGKRVTKAKTVQKTVNPFNKNPATGAPKTRDEVLADCRAEADAWEPRDWRCSTCGFTAWVRSLDTNELESALTLERWDEQNFRRSGKDGRAKKCRERIAVYEARLAEITGSAS